MNAYDTITLKREQGISLHKYYKSYTDPVYIAGFCAIRDEPISLELLEQVIYNLEKHWAVVEADIKINGGNYEDNEAEELINLMHELEFALFYTKE